jgi:hypothetical protein
MLSQNCPVTVSGAAETARMAPHGLLSDRTDRDGDTAGAPWLLLLAVPVHSGKMAGGLGIPAVQLRSGRYGISV